MRLLGHRESLNMDFERQFLSSLKARTLEYPWSTLGVPFSTHFERQCLRSEANARRRLCAAPKPAATCGNRTRPHRAVCDSL